MGDNYTPPGMIRLIEEIDRQMEDGNQLPERIDLPAVSGATSFLGRILAGKADVQTAMKAIQDANQAAGTANQLKADMAARRRRGWTSLRNELAMGQRKGWWWFPDFEGRIETIPPHWWNSNDAQAAAGYGTVKLSRVIEGRVRDLLAEIVLELERTKEVTIVAPDDQINHANEYDRMANQSPAKTSRPLSIPPNPIALIVKVFQIFGVKPENKGVSKEKWRQIIRSENIKFSEREFTSAFDRAIDEGYISKLKGAPKKEKQTKRS